MTKNDLNGGEAMTNDASNNPGLSGISIVVTQELIDAEPCWVYGIPFSEEEVIAMSSEELIRLKANAGGYTTLSPKRVLDDGWVEGFVMYSTKDSLALGGFYGGTARWRYYDDGKIEVE